MGAGLAAACAAYLDDADGLGFGAASAGSTIGNWRSGCRIGAAAALVEHAIVSVVAEVDRRGVWAIDGHRSVLRLVPGNRPTGPAAETTHRLRTVTLLAGLDAVPAPLPPARSVSPKCK